MRTIGIVLTAALFALPLAANAAELETPDTDTAMPAPAVHHHRHAHRSYEPRVHFGYYWYQWGYRTGGTRRSWIGSSFAGVTPWWCW
jgi:hypothetical protein